MRLSDHCFTMPEAPVFGFDDPEPFFDMADPAASPRALAFRAVEACPTPPLSGRAPANFNPREADNGNRS